MHGLTLLINTIFIAEGVPSKVVKILNFMIALLRSIADWMTSLFNSISRNYRLVAAKLKDDHIKVKQQIQVN